MCLAIRIEDWQVGDTLEISFRRRLVGYFDVAVELAGRSSRHAWVFAYCHCENVKRKTSDTVRSQSRRSSTNLWGSRESKYEQRVTTQEARSRPSIVPFQGPRGRHY